MTIRKSEVKIRNARKNSEAENIKKIPSNTISPEAFERLKTDLENTLEELELPTWNLRCQAVKVERT